MKTYELSVKLAHHVSLYTQFATVCGLELFPQFEKSALKIVRLLKRALDTDSKKKKRKLKKQALNTVLKLERCYELIEKNCFVFEIKDIKKHSKKTKKALLKDL